MTKKIAWYRTKLDRDVLKGLTQRSNTRGLVQSLSVLGVWLITGSLSLHFFLEQQWILMAVACYAHALVFGFLGMEASVHELSHGTPFRTKWLNEFFYGLFAFLTWNDPVHFRASHMKHHQNTVIEGLDKEVMLAPAPLGWKDYLSWLTFDYKKTRMILFPAVARFFGRDLPDVFAWNPLFEKDDPRRKRSFWWNRFLILGHAALIALFIYFQLWVLLWVVSFGYWFTGFFSRGCGMQQHIGLTPNVPDWRVSCHTMTMRAPVSFLYWNMNYHIEHHMYAAVPFFKLKKLHKAIEHDTPKPVGGFFRGFAHVVGIQKKQREDPSYTYKPVFPETAVPPDYSKAVHAGKER